MDKPTYQPQKNPGFPNSRMASLYKTSIPDKKISSELINKMFIEVAGGNFLKIQEFLLSNSMSMLPRNELDETAIHIIIKNSNITPQEKIQLVKLAIKEGAGVSTPDQNNIFPIHLACKKQLFDVVKLLINSGADVRCLDSQFKSPLHYAVSGDTVQCISKQKRKMKPLIPYSKKATTSNSSKIKEFEQLLHKFLFEDKNTAKYIKQITSTLTNLEQMYPYDFKEKTENAKKIIIDVVQNNEVSDKKLEILNKITNLKASMNDFIMQKIGDGITPIKIDPNIYDGWGPDKLSLYQQNRILPDKSLKMLTFDIERMLDKEKSDSIINFQSSFGQLNQEKQNLLNLSENFTATIGYCHQFSKVIGNNISDDLKISANAEGLYNLSIISNEEFLFTQDYDSLVDVPNITLPCKIDPTWSYEYPEHSGQYVTPFFTTHLDNDGNEVKNTVIGYINFVKTSEYPIWYGPRVSKSDAEKLKRANKYPEECFLTNEKPMIVGDYILTKNVKNENKLDINLQKYNKTENSEGVYFDTKFKIYTYLIKYLYTDLHKSYLQISTHINNKKFWLVYEEIAKGVASVLSICLCCSVLKEEIPELKNHFTNFLLLFKGKENFLSHDKKFLTEQIQGDISETIKDVNKISGQLDNIYNAVSNIIGSFNTCISIIENMSARMVCYKYFEYENEFDKFYKKPTLDEITNIVITPIERIKALPPSLDDFKKLKGSNIAETKKNVINEFIPQITYLNVPTFIRSDLSNDTKPTLGFVKFADKLDISKLFQMYNPETKSFDNFPVQIKESQKGNPNFLEPDDTFVGEPKFVTPKQYKKEETMPPVIGNFLNVYLKMIKYSVVRWVINEMSNKMQVKGDDYNIAIDNIFDEIKDFVSFDETNKSFIFVLIGRYVDNLLIDFMKGIVTFQTNKIIAGFIEQKEVSQNFISHEINNISDNGIIIPITPVEFSVKMNEIFENLVSSYEKDFLMIELGNENDLTTFEKKDIYIQKLINFNYEINSMAESCYTINHKLIDLLIWSGSNINAKDNLGNTALHYAVNMQNKPVIKILLKADAIVWNKVVKNRLGKNILQHALDEYSDILNVLMVNKFDVCKKLTENLMDKFKKKSMELYGNNEPKYTDMILPMCLYLLNHHIYLIGKGYPKMWSHKLNKEFEKELGISVSNTLPILDIKISENDFAKTKIPNSNIDYFKMKIKQNSTKIDELIHAYENYTAEKEDIVKLIESGKATRADQERDTQLGNVLSECEQEIKFLENQKTSLENKINVLKINKTKKLNNLAVFIENNKNNLKTKLSRKTSIIELYDSVFIDVINGSDKKLLDSNLFNYDVDIKTYPLIWKKLFKNINKGSYDHTQILDIMANYQKNILDKKGSAKLNNFFIVQQYYKNVIYQFADDYFEMSREYNYSNYAMTAIMDIIIHIVKRIMCVTLYDTILEGLTRYVVSIFPYSEQTKMYKNDSEYHKYIVDLILSTVNENGKIGSSGSRLLSYIFNIMPCKIVKVVLDIYEGENEGEADPDKTSSLEQIFEQISVILSSNTSINFESDNIFINNLKEYVYPYYIDYMEMIIKEMFNIISNYLRSLQYQSKMLDIIEELSIKAEKEKKNCNAK
jgi:ankyrin repeat protein